MTKNSLAKNSSADKGIISWLKNSCLRQILKFNKNRNKNLWLFAAWEGQKYSDNSRYLFEYINEFHKNISCVWVTKDKAILSNLKSKGMQCVLVGSEECKQAELKAGVCFYTNGIDDFGDVNYAYGAKFVCLMHGVSFKKLGFERPSNNNFVLKILKKIKYSFYYSMYADYYITSSEYMRKRMNAQFFGADMDKIFITGQPRNDIFYNVQELKSTDNKILYMPTYRNNPHSAMQLENILKELADDLQLRELLKNYNFTLYIKLHYLSNKVDIGDNPVVKILTDKESCDVQELLLNSRILITDYSSVVNDFALLNRPVIMFPFDKESYLVEEGIVSEFNEILKPETTAYDTPSLLKIIEKILTQKESSYSTIRCINKFFNDDSLLLGDFSKNVYEVILKNLSNE